ncbi:MAG: hypothetical protein RIT45_2923 [Pseudomonadota bacterium]
MIRARRGVKRSGRSAVSSLHRLTYAVGLLACLGILSACGAAGPQRRAQGSTAPTVAHAQTTKSASAPVTADAQTALPSPATPTASSRAADAPPHRCTVGWWPQQEPALPQRDGHFVDVEGRCDVVVIRFDSVQWYEMMRVHRLAEVRARLARQDPGARFEVTVGRPPLGVARSAEELEAASIPPRVVPRRLDFSRSILVRYEAALEPRTHCRDHMLGMTPAAARAYRKDMQRWQRRAEQLRDRWRIERPPTVQRLAGADVLVLPTPNRSALLAKPQAMCTTSYIWQQTIAVVLRSDLTIRVAER